MQLLKYKDITSTGIIFGAVFCELILRDIFFILMKNDKIFNTIKFLGGANTFESLPDNKLIEIAFWGRSNVGKSSTINAVFNRKSIARISRTPGRTQQINLFTIGDDQVVIADLPGYGYAAVSKTVADNLYRLCYNYLHKRQLALFFLLIDSRRGLMPIDYEVLESLKVLGHRLCILITKVDLVKDSDLNKLKNELSLFDCLVTSNKSNTGIIDLKRKIIDVINERQNCNRKL